MQPQTHSRICWEAVVCQPASILWEAAVLYPLMQSFQEA